MAPPSTPTPRRFLAPRRPATQSVTPKPLPGGTQQFQATPRFSLPSTPRDAAAPPSTTPAPSAVFSRQRQEPISDIIDSSPPPPTRRLHDSIEVDSLPPSSLVPSSSSQPEDEDPPSPKRRRLSASLHSVPDASVTSSIRGSSPSECDAGSDVPVPDAEDHLEEQAVGEPPRAPQTQQPTFRPVPRFKPVDLPEGVHHEPLPDAFSPRRRGDKFVPGGLAAGLRDWLMDLESSTGAKKDGDWAAKVFVEQVRSSSGMRLIHGRYMKSDGHLGGTGPDTHVQRTRLVLAGDGRLTGLARRNEVSVGSLLGIAKPVWEVGLGAEGQWVMACDWKVL